MVKYSVIDPKEVIKKKDERISIRVDDNDLFMIGKLKLHHVLELSDLIRKLIALDYGKIQNQGEFFEETPA